MRTEQQSLKLASSWAKLARAQGFNHSQTLWAKRGLLRLLPVLIRLR
jgi:hypothetical protein